MSAPAQEDLLRLRADPDATARRLEDLRTYMDANVLGPTGFCCATAEACRSSIRAGDRFFEGQLSHVGHHYDLFLSGRPLRIMVVGQEYAAGAKERGTNKGEVSLEERYEMIHDRSGLARRYYAEPGRKARNPHMRGTTSALRTILAEGPGSDHEGEIVDTIDGERFHIFDAFALVNVLLCSAGPPASAMGRSTTTMRRNCLRHFAASVEILQPTLIVLQGVGVQRWVRSFIGAGMPITEYLAEVTIGGTRSLVCAFSHPAAHGSMRWGDRLDGPYLTQVVVPTLRTARARIAHDPPDTNRTRGPAPATEVT